MKPSIISLEEIKRIVSSIDLLPVVEQGFVAYASERAVVPPVGELLLHKGGVHIKSGHLSKNELVELGNIIDGTTTGGTSDFQITITDLTGVAVQDIKNPEVVCRISI